MPYGLIGATRTCQRGIDMELQNCKYCVDDCIVYSDDMQSHITDLCQVLGQLMEAGFTSRLRVHMCLWYEHLNFSILLMV